jgi:hypothetical protein
MGIIGGLQQLGKSVVRLDIGIDDQAVSIDCQPDGGTHFKMKEVENSRRDGEHNRAADFAKISCMHGDPLLVI